MGGNGNRNSPSRTPLSRTKHNFVVTDRRGCVPVCSWQMSAHVVVLPMPRTGLAICYRPASSELSDRQKHYCMFICYHVTLVIHVHCQATGLLIFSDMHGIACNYPYELQQGEAQWSHRNRATFRDRIVSKVSCLCTHFLCRFLLCYCLIIIHTVSHVAQNKHDDDDEDDNEIS